MNYSLSIESNPELISDEFMSELKVAAQDAMAIAFSDITLQNFGESGLARAADWDSLKEDYAEEYHDGDRTPTLVLHGNLRASIDVELGNLEYSSCFTDNEYAAKQQWGDGSINLPARPFFPIVGTPDNFELTEFASDRCYAAAESAILLKLNEE